MAAQTVFRHRINRDGTHDLICPVCFRTVASAATDDNIADAEKRHICNIADLYNLRTWRKLK